MTPDVSAVSTRRTFILAVLAAVTIVTAYQEQLSWSEYQAIHRRKVRHFPKLDTIFPWAVTPKGAMFEDPESYVHLMNDPKYVFNWLRTEHDFKPHLMSSVKRRKRSDGEYQYSIAHLVQMHDDGTQTEVYMFPVDNGTHLYAHNEVSVLSPKRHLYDTEHINGDPKDVLPNSPPD